MSVTTGKNWKVARYVTTTPYNIGGIPSTPEFSKHTEQTEEQGTGQRRLVNLHTTNIYWEITWKMKLQRLASFVNAYCMITAEGDLPSCNLYMSDGVTERGWTGCLVDKCEVNIDQRGSITADITAFSNANEAKSLSVTYETEAPITKSGVSVLSVGGTAITKWTNIRFGVSNNVAREPTGSTDVVSEIFARHPVYTGQITLVKTAATPHYAFDTTKEKTVIITIVDNQGAPVTTTFTFTNAAVNVDRVHVAELGLTYEVISFTAKQLTIS